MTVPPPSFNAATASPSERRLYGIPKEPPVNSPEYPKWKAMVDQPIHFVTPPESLVEVPATREPSTTPQASTGLAPPASADTGRGNATTGTNKVWSGYLNIEGRHESYTEVAGYFIEPTTVNKTPAGCESNFGSYVWAGIGGWGPGNPALAQDGTGQLDQSVEEELEAEHRVGRNQAWYETIPKGKLGGGTIAVSNFYSSPGSYFLANTEYLGDGEISYYMYNYKKHEAMHATGNTELAGETADYIVERQEEQNLYNFKAVTFQGFTNNKAFRELPTERVEMENGIKEKDGHYELNASPTNIVNNYEFTDEFLHCKGAKESIGEKIGAGRAAPIADTGGSSEVTSTSAKLSGTINPEEGTTTYHFEYGTEADNYGESTEEVSAGEGKASVPVTASLTGLRPGTIYHYRVIANNPDGTSAGAEATFTTSGAPPPPPPTVATEGASGIAAYTATLKATVNPNSLDTHYYFEYGTNSTLFESYAPAPPGNDAGSGSTPVQVSVGLTELAPNTTYYYRTVATNSTGTTYGVEKEFKTLPPWTIQSTQNPHGSSEADGFMGVSCWSATACDAVGINTNSEDEVVGLVERWNDSGWAVQSTPKSTGATEDSLESVACLSASECEATGYAEVAEGRHVTLAERWNGTAWSVQSTPTEGNDSNLVSVSCSSASECVASGVYLSSSGKQSTLVELWNGKEWKILTTATLPKEDERSWFESVSCSSSKDCTAVGVVVTTLNGIVPLAESYNGSKWTLQTTPTPENSLEAQLSGVSCSATSACTAVGEYYSSTEKAYRALIERYNGTSWQLQESPSPVGTPAPKESHWSLHAVSCPTSGSCVAIGSYAQSASARNLLLGEQWNGTSWELALPVDRTGTGVVSDEPRAVSCSAALTCTLAGVTSKEKSTSETLAERMEP